MKIIIIAYFLVINVVAFAMYGIDKRKAIRNQWRIPEKTLIGVALIGGSVGAILGMRIFHHKTKHSKFYVGLPLILILHIVIVGVFVYLAVR